MYGPTPVAPTAAERLAMIISTIETRLIPRFDMPRLGFPANDNREPFTDDVRPDQRSPISNIEVTP